jgi:hypothetical protein
MAPRKAWGFVSRTPRPGHRIRCYQTGNTHLAIMRNAFQAACGRSGGQIYRLLRQHNREVYRTTPIRRSTLLTMPPRYLSWRPRIYRVPHSCRSELSRHSRAARRRDSIGWWLLPLRSGLISSTDTRWMTTVPAASARDISMWNLISPTSAHNRASRSCRHRSRLSTAAAAIRR